MLYPPAPPYILKTNGGQLVGVGFLAMMGQIPLVFLTEPLEKMRGPGTTIGNCIFWITFCLVGQPFGVLYYFYRFVLRSLSRRI
jgi:hypothetical protein